MVLPRELCGGQKAEPSPANYFSALVKEGMNAEMVPKVAHTLAIHYKKATGHHAAFHKSYRPSVAAIMAEARKLKVVWGLPATGNPPKAGGTSEAGEIQPRGRAPQPAAAAKQQAKEARPGSGSQPKAGGKHTASGKPIPAGGSESGEENFPNVEDVAFPANTSEARKQAGYLENALKERELTDTTSLKDFQTWEKFVNEEHRGGFERSGFFVQGEPAGGLAQ